MNATASPRPSAVIGQTAKFIRALETVDVTSADLQRVIDDPEFRATIAAAFGHTVDTVYIDARTLSGAAIGRVLDRIYAKYCYAQDEVLDPLHNRFQSPEAFQPLLDCLKPARMRIVSVVFGLLNDTPQSNRQAAELMGVRVSLVNTNVVRGLQEMSLVMAAANRRQRAQANDLPVGSVTRTTPISQFYLALSPMLRNALTGLERTTKKGFFAEVGNLLDDCDCEMVQKYVRSGSYSISYQDKVETPDGAKLFDELVEKLAVHGLALRPE